MDEKIILLVEDNPNDVLLTERAFKQARIHNKLQVAKDGAEALDYLFGTESWASRDVRDMPLLVLLDIKLPKINGLEVLKIIRADNRTNSSLLLFSHHLKRKKTLLPVTP